MENYINGKLGSIRVVHLFIQMTVYYLLFFGLLFGSVYFFPGVKDYLPFGYTANVAPISEESSLQDLADYANLSTSAIENSIKLASAIFGVTLVMLPVTWLYLKSRVVKRLDQSLVQTMLLLPIAVAGVVSIVQHSIALAFSLAGIVAGVRFRNTLKNTGDSLFIFITIGAGLAAGTRALEIAVVVTMCYNFIFLLLWDLDYGGDHGEKYMRHSDDLGDKTPKADSKE